jgi:4'-phosphopantetheinyl transferase EntD
VAIPAAADRAPIWPSGFTGSISHANGYCVAVAARVTDAGQKRGITALGVDVEQVGQVLPTLWPQLMCQEEIARLQALDEQDRDVTASLIFSAKEAFYKAQYTLTGGWVDFGDASIVLSENSFRLQVSNAGLAIAQLAGRFEGRFLIGSGRVITALAI